MVGVVEVRQKEAHHDAEDVHFSFSFMQVQKLPAILVDVFKSSDYVDAMCKRSVLASSIPVSDSVSVRLIYFKYFQLLFQSNADGTQGL